MVEWCPKCGAMLTPGTEKCPACGTRLAGRKANRLRDEMSGKDIFWLSAYIVGIALIPMILVVLLATICILVLAR